MKLVLLLVLCSLTFCQSTYKGCPGKGDTKNVTIQELNLLKNRDGIPAEKDFDPNVTFESLVTKGDDLTRWDQNKAAKITAQIKLIKSGGVESCNCHSKDELDTHIELVSLNKSGNPVIVEITPRFRERMKAKGIDWSTATLKKIVGSVVTVEGWLFPDIEHKQNADNTAPKGKHNWRATIWEIHPITSLTVIK